MIVKIINIKMMKTKKITTEFCKDTLKILFIIVLHMAHLEGVEPSTC